MCSIDLLNYYIIFMKLASKLIGLPVVSFETGKKFEKVEDIIYDDQTNSIVALLVDRGGMFSDAKIIEYSKISSVGDDAVIVVDENVIVSASESELVSRAVGEKVSVRGKQIMTEDGKDLGKVTDLSIDEVIVLLINEIQRTNAKRVVLDSLSGFELALAPTFRADFRESMLRLVTTLTDAGTTVVVTSELEDRYTDLRFSPYGTAFLTDAIIVQRYIEVESRLRRLIAVVKVRGSHHSDELREYTIDKDGLHIGAMLAEQEGLLGGRPTKKRDYMLSENEK